MIFLKGHCVQSQGTKVAAVIHSSVDRLFSKKALAAMNCVYTMHLTGI